VLTVATNINHGAAKNQNALQVLTVAISINPGSGIGPSTGLAKAWNLRKMDGW
jgi:hypothetical protein